ncbi:MAG: type II secretion system F family protein [Deltaproteobacteria bacterium]|nr:type II secretion system F family protein [Deltaproteobacteria bacterium]
MALFWLLDSRKAPVPDRFREVLGVSGAPVRTPMRRAAAWMERLLGRKDRKARESEEIVARVTADDPSGGSLLLSQAGYRTAAAARFYWWARIVSPLAFAAGAIAVGKTMGMPYKAILLLAVAGTAAGLFLPDAFLKMKARRRQEAITDALPDGLDLMTVCVEAGLGINSAFVKIAEEFRISSPALSEEFDVVNREMVAGKPRTEALRALASRTGVEDVKSLVAMLIQTERLGTSLAQSLRVHSDSLRVKRRQKAEEAAAKTTIKLVFPLVFLLFPALFIVILGPGVLQILRVFFPTMGGGTP